VNQPAGRARLGNAPEVAYHPSMAFDFGAELVEWLGLRPDVARPAETAQ
jgi:hypothetical protein